MRRPPPYALLTPVPTYRIERPTSPLAAAGHDTPIGAYLTYANVTRDANKRPLPLDAWRERETQRNATQREYLNANTRTHEHATTWRIDRGRINDARPNATRDMWRARYRVALLPIAYRGTLLRDGMTQDATRVTMACEPIATTFALSNVVAYNAEWVDAFYVSQRYSAHGARIAATLSPHTFTID